MAIQKVEEIGGIRDKKSHRLRDYHRSQKRKKNLKIVKDENDSAKKIIDSTLGSNIDVTA